MQLRTLMAIGRLPLVALLRNSIKGQAKKSIVEGILCARRLHHLVQRGPLCLIKEPLEHLPLRYAVTHCQPLQGIFCVDRYDGVDPYALTFDILQVSRPISRLSRCIVGHVCLPLFVTQ